MDSEVFVGDMLCGLREKCFFVGVMIPSSRLVGDAVFLLCACLWFVMIPCSRVVGDAVLLLNTYLWFVMIPSTRVVGDAVFLLSACLWFVMIPSSRGWETQFFC
ncbi:hypothetical protein CEXT_81991 [Caerostris extrusa]|uniref:Transmembrane protein n=1 Tax=Caerostris extrusa TaxID=172846 RepID=A0AAV4Q1M4_CAEEX|nr:hypothetical protein CEXT_81991 [Caerostris extrusa]